MLNIESMTDEQRAEYMRRCDALGCAEFRMRRELCGIEIAELAEALGVRLDTAKRWEHPTKGLPPSLRAWAYIDNAYEKLLNAVEEAVSQVEDIAEQHGEPNVVNVAYRRGNHRTRDGETTGMSNAVARATAMALTTLGYTVRAQWADDGAAGLAARAPR